MGNIIEASELPDAEKVYLKKDFLGWRVVEPYKNPETGKVNYFNILCGGKKGLFILIVIMLLSGLFYLGINELVSNYKQVADDPCKFCTDCHEQTLSILSNMKSSSYEKFNISNLNLTIS